MTGSELDVNDSGQVWDASPRDLERKLERHYDVDGINLRGDFYDRDTGERLMDVLTYFDGDRHHLIAEDVPVYGHGPSGAAGVDSDSLPPQERVQSVVETAEQGGDGDE